MICFRTQLIYSGARLTGSPYQGLLKIKRSWAWIMSGNGEAGRSSTLCVHSVHIVQATHKVTFYGNSLLGPLNVTVHLVRGDVQFLPTVRSKHWRWRDGGTTPPVTSLSLPADTLSWFPQVGTLIMNENLSNKTFWEIWLEKRASDTRELRTLKTGALCWWPPTQCHSEEGNEL